jgi:hypothetical protein
MVVVIVFASTAWSLARLTLLAIAGLEVCDRTSVAGKLRPVLPVKLLSPLTILLVSVCSLLD